MFYFLLSMIMYVNALNFSNVFGDHMVLQSDTSAILFGFDTPGSTVNTTFHGSSVSSVTGPDSIWRLALPPQPPTTGRDGFTITVSSSVSESASLSDVLFGSVFFMAGQSNAQFSLSGALNASAEIAAANFPRIRLFTVGQGTSSTTPRVALGSIEQPWSVCTPQSVSNNNDFGWFSAVGYLFARDIHVASAVPIGMISNNWGGTCLESWCPGSVSAACGVANVVPTLFNAMYEPYLVGPMSVTGFLWSQGECNADKNNTAFYACAFPLFIQSWRNAFNVPDAFFGFQVLPPYINDSGKFNPYSLPFERDAQLTGLSLENVVASNAVDLGDPLAPHGSVHPRNKTTVASRFAAAARAIIWGEAVPYLNPRFASASALPTVGSQMTVFINFEPTTVLGGGLSLNLNAACPVDQTVPLSECGWIEVQTGDGIWRNATGVALSADSAGLILTLSVPSNAIANATRGMFTPWPVVQVYSADGQRPALPWPPTQIMPLR